MDDFVDGVECQALVEAACTGDERAWQDLIGRLWPSWLVQLRHSRDLGPLAQSEDHVQNVATHLVEKLSPRGGAALGLFSAWQSANRNKSFGDWLRIVTAFTVRDYVRRTLGRAKRDPELPSMKRLINEFATSAAIDEVGGLRPHFTMAQTARQMLDYARGHLSPAQFHGLLLWLQGCEPDELEELMEDGRDGRKLVRSAIAVLRRRFRPDREPDG